MNPSNEQPDSKGIPTERKSVSLGSKVDTYEPGHGFGELALLSNDPMRNASVVCEESADILVVNKGLFDRTVKATQEKEAREKHEFVESCKLFSHWTPRVRRQVEMSLTRRMYKVGSTVLKQGGHFHGIIFIIRGFARLVVDAAIHSKSYPSIKDPLSETNSSRKRPLIQSYIETKRTDGYATTERKVLDRKQSVLFLRESKPYGDIEFSLCLPSYLGSLHCETEVEAFHLNHKHCHRLLGKNPEVLQILREDALTQTDRFLSLHTQRLSIDSITARGHHDPAPNDHKRGRSHSYGHILTEETNEPTGSSGLVTATAAASLPRTDLSGIIAPSQVQFKRRYTLPPTYRPTRKRIEQEKPRMTHVKAKSSRQLRDESIDSLTLRHEQLRRGYLYEVGTVVDRLNKKLMAIRKGENSQVKAFLTEIPLQEKRKEIFQEMSTRQMSRVGTNRPQSPSRVKIQTLTRMVRSISNLEGRPDRDLNSFLLRAEHQAILEPRIDPKYADCKPGGVVICFAKPCPYRYYTGEELTDSEHEHRHTRRHVLPPAVPRHVLPPSALSRQRTL